MSTIPQSKTLERVLWIKPNVETEQLNKSFFRNNLLVDNGNSEEIYRVPELHHNYLKGDWYGKQAVDEIIDNLAREVLSKLTESTTKLRARHNNLRYLSIQEGFNFSTYLTGSRTPFPTTKDREKTRQLVWRTAGGRLKMREEMPTTTNHMDKNYTDELERFTYDLFRLFNVRGTLDIETDVIETESLQSSYRSYYRQGSAGSGRSSRISVYGNDVEDDLYLFVKEDSRDGRYWGIETYRGIEETPFYKDAPLNIRARFIHPNLTIDGSEVFESQDIEECRIADKKLEDITNYGLEIKIQGTVPEDFSQEDFEFYFNDMWVDLIADFTTMFKKFVKAHSTMVRNFFAEAWGGEKIIPSILEEQVTMSNLEYARYAPKVEEFYSEENHDDHIHYSASRYLDFIENPFPSENAELETLCTLFSFGSSNKKCNLHMMQSVNNAVSQVTDEDIENLIE